MKWRFVGAAVNLMRFAVGLFVLGEAVDLGENDYHMKMLRYPCLMSK
jgi:hypothetical protein